MENNNDNCIVFSSYTSEKEGDSSKKCIKLTYVSLLCNTYLDRYLFCHRKNEDV